MGQKPIEGSTKIAGSNFERLIDRQSERANGPNGVERRGEAVSSAEHGVARPNARSGATRRAGHRVSDARNNPSLGASEMGLVGGLSAGEMAEWSKAHPC
jgi:hypothetical protein